MGKLCSPIDHSIAGAAEDIIAMVDKIDYTMGNSIRGDIHIEGGKTYIFRTC